MDTLVNNTQQVIGNYRLISVIGKGSFAVVYKGEKLLNEKEKDKNLKKTQSSDSLEFNEVGSSKIKKSSSEHHINDKDDNSSKDEPFVMPNTIAIKSIIKERLNKKLTVNLRLEINILMKIRHKHIVQLYGIESSEKTINLLMEYCARGDLSLYMKKNFTNRDNNPLIGPWKGFNEYIVLEFLFQLASALKYMNEKSVVHRDLKPQNILLTFDPNRRLHPLPRPTYSNPTSYCLVPLPYLKLADFGFARSLNSTNLASTLCGSPLYMAPEILDCKTYSANVDLWSLGTILYELVMSRTPYRAMNHIELLKKIKCSSGIHFPGEKTKGHDKLENNNDKSSEELNNKVNDIPSLINKDEENKDIISDTSDVEATANGNDILNINNQDHHKKSNQKVKDNSTEEMISYAKDSNAFTSTLKELIRNLLKQKSEERITFKVFFDIVDYQLKPQWEIYRNHFNEILKEKESSFNINDEIDFDHNEENQKYHQFISLDSDFKLDMVRNEIHNEIKNKNSVSSSNEDHKTVQEQVVDNLPNISEKHPTISSFDDSNYQIIQADNIYSDGKDSPKEKDNNSTDVVKNSLKVKESKINTEIESKISNINPSESKLNTPVNNTKKSNKSISFETPEISSKPTELNNNEPTTNPFDYTVEIGNEASLAKPLPFHKRFYSFPNHVESIHFLENYHHHRDFNPTFSSSIPSHSSNSSSSSNQQSSQAKSSSNYNSSNIDSFDANIMNKISIQWDPSQYNHIFQNNKGHNNSFKATTYQFQKYSPYKKHWRRSSQPHLLNCHSFPEKRFSFSEKQNLKKRNVLNNNLFPLSKMATNESQPPQNVNPASSIQNSNSNNNTENVYQPLPKLSQLPQNENQNQSHISKTNTAIPSQNSYCPPNQNNINNNPPNLNDRFANLTLEEKMILSRHRSLSRSKSNSLEKIMEKRNGFQTTSINATPTTTTTMDNEITERNDDSPFPFINSFESRSRSFSSSTSSSTTILERISLKNLNGGTVIRSKSSLNSLDNSPKFTTPVGSIPSENHGSFSQKPSLMSQLSQVPDIFNAPQMDFEEMAPFPELFHNSGSHRGSVSSRSRKGHQSNSNIYSNPSIGSMRSNGSSSNSLYRSNSLINNNNNSNYLGSGSSSNGSITNVIPNNSGHAGNNSKSYSSGSINLAGNTSSRSNLYINTLVNRSNHSGNSFGSCNNSPFTQEKLNGMLFNNNSKHQSYLKPSSSASPSNGTRKVRKSYSTNFIQDNPSIDSHNAPSPPFIFSELNRKHNSIGDINASRNEPSSFNNYTPHQTEKFVNKNDLPIREEGYIIVDENAVKLNCYADDLSSKEVEDSIIKKERNTLKIDLQTFSHNPKIIHPFNQKISSISICAFSIQLIAEKYITSDTTTAVTLYLKALALYQYAINIAKSLSASIYEKFDNDARHELYILIQWVRDQYNESLELVSDLYVDETKECEIVEDIIWNEALLLVNNRIFFI